MAVGSNSGHFPSGFSFENSDKMACQSRVKEAEIARIIRPEIARIIRPQCLYFVCFRKGIALSLFSERGS